MAHPIYELLVKGHLTEAYDLAKRHVEARASLPQSHRIAAELAAISFGAQRQISPETVISGLRLSKQFGKMGMKREQGRIENAVGAVKSEFKKSFPRVLSNRAKSSSPAEAQKSVRLVRSFYSGDPFFEIAHAIYGLDCNPHAVQASLGGSRLRPSKQKAILEQLTAYNALCAGDSAELNGRGKHVDPLALLPWALLSPRLEFMSAYASWILRAGSTDSDIAEIIASIAKGSALAPEATLPHLIGMTAAITSVETRLRILHSIGVHSDDSLTAGSFADVSPSLRLRHLKLLQRSRLYSDIVDLTHGTVHACGVDEALVVARAMAESGRIGEALALTRMRVGQFADSRERWRVAMLVANRAAAWKDMIEFCKGALRNGTGADDAVHALRHVAAALRKMRFISRVERLGEHITWRYRNGHLPLLMFINFMRAINRRSELPGLELAVEASGDASARVVFIEALIELSLLTEASNLIEKWSIPLASISDINRTTIVHFNTRKKAFRASTDKEVVDQLMSRVVRQSRSVRRLPANSRKRRILVLASSLGVGGAERQLTHVLAHLDAQFSTCEVVVLVANRKKELKFVNTNISIKYRDELPRLNYKDLAFAVPRHVVEDVEIGLRRPNFSALLQLAAEFRPDTIYNAIGLPTDAVLLGMLTNASKVIVRFGGLSFENSYNASDEQRLQNAVAERLCSLSASRVTFLSNSFSGQHVWSEKLDIPPGTIKVIYNGTVFSELEAQPACDLKKKELFGRSDVAVLGFVGRFHDVKRPFLLIDVASRLAARYPDLRFLFVGDGGLHTAAQARIPPALRKAFVFPGAVSAGLGLLYQTMDVMLLTSRTESFPNVVVEALGYGAFVVSGAVGDVPQVLHDRWSGRVVKSNSFDEFVAEGDQALTRLTEIRADKGRRIADARRRFDVARMLKEYDSILWQSAEEEPESRSLVVKRIKELVAWLKPAQRKAS